VGLVLGEDRPEMPFAEDEHPVGEFCPSGKHEPFRVGVRPRPSGGTSGTPPWPGNAGPHFYDDAAANLSKQADGSVSYLGPGDVVIINVFDNGTPEGGHALVVNDASDVTAGTVDLVSQNGGDPADATTQVSRTISGGSVTVGGGGDRWTLHDRRRHARTCCAVPAC
jgi:hypothetical protein